MDHRQKVAYSKFMALCLRHKPETIGITLDKNGWCNLNEFISKSNENGVDISLKDIKVIVAECSKKRYIISEDGTMIRANQGHSIGNIDLGLKETMPPKILYHGTSKESCDKIMKDGYIRKMNRNHVHLSDNIDTAISVAKRHSSDIRILVIDTEKYNEHKFYISDNGVWLTDDIDTSNITMHDL